MRPPHRSQRSRRGSVQLKITVEPQREQWITVGQHIFGFLQIFTTGTELVMQAAFAACITGLGLTLILKARSFSLIGVANISVPDMRVNNGPLIVGMLASRLFTGRIDVAHGETPSVGYAHRWVCGVVVDRVILGITLTATTSVRSITLERGCRRTSRGARYLGC